MQRRNVTQQSRRHDKIIHILRVYAVHTAARINIDIDEVGKEDGYGL